MHTQDECLARCCTYRIITGTAVVCICTHEKHRLSTIVIVVVLFHRQQSWAAQTGAETTQITVTSIIKRLPGTFVDKHFFSVFTFTRSHSLTAEYTLHIPG